MGDPLLTVSASVQCPHGGLGTIVPSQSAVTAGDTVCTADDDVTIEGCGFMVGNVASPCVTVEWQDDAGACTAGGSAILTTGTEGQCLSAESAPQGPVILDAGQTAAVTT
jgi:hypothetical protein